MNHFTIPAFWQLYEKLPTDIQALADKNFGLLKTNALHPSLRLKKVGPYWSARVGLSYRVLARERPEGLVWFWIGSHAEYDEILNRGI